MKRIRSFPLDGKRFGRLTVLSRTEKPAGYKNRDAFWLCQCDCGNTHIASAKSLREKKTGSCGCLGAETQFKPKHTTRVTHGMTKSKEYRCWGKMIYRCENPRADNYPYYGGRGIKVYEQWRHSFETFLQDMGPAPSLSHSLDRIDFNGDYAPENCRWATKEEQARNRRDRALIHFNGKSQLLIEWSDETGIPLKRLHDRIYRDGWTIERALTTL